MKKGSKISAVALALAAAGAWLILRARSNKESEDLSSKVVAIYYVKTDAVSGKTVVKAIVVYADGHAETATLSKIALLPEYKKAGIVYAISKEEFAAKLSEYGINA